MSSRSAYTSAMFALTVIVMASLVKSGHASLNDGQQPPPKPEDAIYVPRNLKKAIDKLINADWEELTNDGSPSSPVQLESPLAAQLEPGGVDQAQVLLAEIKVLKRRLAEALLSGRSLLRDGPDNSHTSKLVRRAGRDYRFRSLEKR